MRFAFCMKKCDVRKNSCSCVHCHKQICGTQMVNSNPLLEDAMLCQVCAAKLIKFFVVQIRFAADPERSYLDGDHVVAFLREKQIVTPVCDFDGNAWMIDNPEVDISEPLAGGLHEVWREFSDINVLKGKAGNCPQRAAGPKSDDEGAVELPSKKRRNQAEP